MFCVSVFGSDSGQASYSLLNSFDMVLGTHCVLMAFDLQEERKGTVQLMINDVTGRLNWAALHSGCINCGMERLANKLQSRFIDSRQAGSLQGGISNEWVLYTDWEAVL